MKVCKAWQPHRVVGIHAILECNLEKRSLIRIWSSPNGLIVCFEATQANSQYEGGGGGRVVTTYSLLCSSSCRPPCLRGRGRPLSQFSRFGSEHGKANHTRWKRPAYNLTRHHSGIRASLQHCIVDTLAAANNIHG